MPSRIDLPLLSPADALDLAVLMGEEARQRYLDFAEIMAEVRHNREVAAFCRVMVGNEERHGNEHWQCRHQLYPYAPARVTADMLYDVEAPEHENPTAFMTPRAAMLMALDTEKNADSFFRGAMAGKLRPEVPTLFAELVALPAEEPVRRDDLADEPMGQD